MRTTVDKIAGWQLGSRGQRTLTKQRRAGLLQGSQFNILSHSLRKAETNQPQGTGRQQGPHNEETSKGYPPNPGPQEKAPGASWMPAEKVGHTSKWETPRKESTLLWEVRPKLPSQAAHEKAHRLWKESKTPVYSTVPLSSRTGKKWADNICIYTG